MHPLKHRILHTNMSTVSEQLAEAMEEGYRTEAESPSIDEEWETVEADGL